MSLSSKNDDDDGFEPSCQLSSADGGIRTSGYIALSTYSREVQLAPSTARDWSGPSHKWTSPLNHWRPPCCLVPEPLCQCSLKYEHMIIWDLSQLNICCSLCQFVHKQRVNVRLLICLFHSNWIWKRLYRIIILRCCDVVSHLSHP